MNGIIGEIITTLEYAEDVSSENNIYFSAYIGGSAIEEMDYFLDNQIPFYLLTKIGKDMQGETLLDYITSEYGIDEAQFSASIEKMATDAIASGSPGNAPKTYTAEDCVALYRRAF